MTGEKMRDQKQEMASALNDIRRLLDELAEKRTALGQVRATLRVNFTSRHTDGIILPAVDMSEPTALIKVLEEYHKLVERLRAELGDHAISTGGHDTQPG